MNYDIYNQFSILCVDDDESILFTYKLLFEMFFKKVYTARNGEEGLEVFKKNQVDIIITDYAMPKLNGVEMSARIRRIDFNIPILLVTAFEDIEILKKALDVNVTAFLKKPLEKEELFSKLELIAKSILAERYLLKKQTKFIEYTTYQEKLAYEKEKLISRLYEKQIDGYDINLFYKPKDILAGDSFLVKNNIIFLVDAMGKGVSAAITAMLSSAFVNYLIDLYDFEEVIKRYISFIQRFLLDEEIVSVEFYKIENDYITYSSFGMPPVLAKNNELKKIKSNNPPISKRTREFNVDKIENRFERIFIYSDGVSEAEIGESIYISEFKKDFMKSKNLEEFLLIFLKKVNILDDISIIELVKKG